MSGLTKKDAEKVVVAWSKYGQEGLKGLEGLELEQASTQLLEAAKMEVTTSQDGTFFGAILQVRWGEGLKDHVDSLLGKLQNRPIGNGRTLRDAFAYIAAMHTQNLSILSKEVLAEALQVKLSDLKRAVINPLGEEAAIATTGRFIFTRHRAIAITAIQILSERTDVDSENLFVELIQAARRAFLSGNSLVPNIGEWNYLSSHFFDIGNGPLGIRLAHAILEVEPENPYFIVNLAQLYRKAGQLELATKVFHSTPEKVKKDRGFYYEWGTTEGINGNHALGVWLAALSLSDEGIRQPPNNTRAKMSLNGLAIAFAELYEEYKAPVFIQACGATAQLGLRLDLDPKNRDLLHRSQSRSRTAGVEDVLPQVAFERFKTGINAAWQQQEGDLPEWIMPANDLNFHGLARLLRISI